MGLLLTLPWFSYSQTGSREGTPIPIRFHWYHVPWFGGWFHTRRKSPQLCFSNKLITDGIQVLLETAREHLLHRHIVKSALFSRSVFSLTL
jgi:hypothetical protein